MDVTQLRGETVRFIALDVETANANQGSICQIGICSVDVSGRLEELAVLVNPQERFDAFNTRLHGIDAGAVRASLTFEQAFLQLLPVLEGHPLVAHSDFDRRAILAACRKYGFETPDFRWHDSVAIARRAWPDLENHKLKTLADHLGIKFAHHDAGADARTAARIVLAAEQVTGLTFPQLVSQTKRQKHPAAEPAPRILLEPIAAPAPPQQPVVPQVIPHATANPAHRTRIGPRKGLRLWHPPLIWLAGTVFMIIFVTSGESETTGPQIAMMLAWLALSAAMAVTLVVLVLLRVKDALRK